MTDIMTNKEAIDILRVINPPRESKRIFDEFIQARDMAISALKKQEEDRWISVTESEPTETGLYLVTEYTVVERKWITRMRIAKCEVSKLHDGRVDVCWRGYGGRVLAWRPLPEVYTEKET